MADVSAGPDLYKSRTFLLQSTQSKVIHESPATLSLVIRVDRVEVDFPDRTCFVRGYADEADYRVILKKHEYLFVRTPGADRIQILRLFPIRVAVLQLKYLFSDQLAEGIEDALERFLSNDLNCA